MGLLEFVIIGIFNYFSVTSCNFNNMLRIYVSHYTPMYAEIKKAAVK